MNFCRNICDSEYRTKCPIATPYGSSSYDKGWSRCMTCAKAFKTEAVRCPCCSYKLRKKARSHYTSRKSKLNMATANAGA